MTCKTYFRLKMNIIDKISVWVASCRSFPPHHSATQSKNLSFPLMCQMQITHDRKRQVLQLYGMVVGRRGRVVTNAKIISPTWFPYSPMVSELKTYMVLPLIELLISDKKIVQNQSKQYSYLPLSWIPLKVTQANPRNKGASKASSVAGVAFHGQGY